MPYKDPDKQRAAWRAYYRRHLDKHRDIRDAKRQEMMAWFAELKKTYACCLCGENDPACIEFHHRDEDQKDFNVGDYIARRFGKTRILNEITKCVALCANCHRKVHAGRLELPE